MFQSIEERRDAVSITFGTNDVRDLRTDKTDAGFPVLVVRVNVVDGEEQWGTGPFGRRRSMRSRTAPPTM